MINEHELEAAMLRGVAFTFVGDVEDCRAAGIRGKMGGTEGGGGEEEEKEEEEKEEEEEEEEMY